MGVVEAALQRGALVGLARAAVGVVGHEADVGGEGAVAGVGGAGGGDRGEGGERGGERFRAYGHLLTRVSKFATRLPKHGACQGAESQ